MGRRARPGVDLVSTYLPKALVGNPPESTPFDGFAKWKGTSFSAALISGVIAARTKPGGVTSREAAEDILQSARDLSPETPPPAVFFD